MLDKWYFEELDRAMKKGIQNGRIYSDVIQKEFNLRYWIDFVPVKEGLEVFFKSKTLDTDPWDWNEVEYRGTIYWNEIPKEYENKIRAK